MPELQSQDGVTGRQVSARVLSSTREWLEAWSLDPSRIWNHPDVATSLAGEGSCPFPVLFESNDDARGLLVLYRAGNSLMTAFGFTELSLREGAGDSDITEEFRGAFGRLLLRSGIVHVEARASVFDHRLRTLAQWHATQRPATYVIDLGARQTSTGFPTAFSESRRRNVRRAKNMGVVVDSSPSNDDLSWFHKVYTSNMEGKDAEIRYYFPLTFFLEHVPQLLSAGLANVYMARVASKPLAGLLTFSGGPYSYAVLLCLGEDARRHYAGDALYAFAASNAADHGASVFVLGGGRSDDDGLAAYKSKLAGGNRLPAYIYTLDLRPAK
jgi:hypothetical protein